MSSESLSSRLNDPYQLVLSKLTRDLEKASLKGEKKLRVAEGDLRSYYGLSKEQVRMLLAHLKDEGLKVKIEELSSAPPMGWPDDGVKNVYYIIKW